MRQDRIARSLLALGALAVLVAPADAAAKGKKQGKAKAKPAAAQPAPPAPEPAPTPAPAPAAAPADATVAASEPTDSVLKRARALYDQLEYESVIPLANAVLERDSITPDQKLDAYLLQASSLAIIGDPIEAEKPFRMLLRGRPDFDMPKDTPPKIISVFRKVQVEETAIREQMRAIEVDRAIKSLKLIGAHPTEAQGGFPLAFAFRLQDPGAAVDTMRILYRRQGESGYSALAVRRDAEGVWRGVLPGEWTASDDGFTVEYYLTTAGPLGELLADGSAAAPHRLAIAAGSVDRATPPPLPLWSFVTAAGVTGALGVAALGTGVGFQLAQADYRTLAAQSGVIDGRDLNLIKDRGNSFALATNVLMISAGVTAIATGVMALFTNWTGATLDEAPAVATE